MPRTSAKSDARRRTPVRLSKELVVDAAIRLLRRVGSKKFSLRALAKELGVTPMALYRHVPNKQALLEEVRHSVLELVPLVVERERAELRGDHPLTEQEIVAKALELVAEHGLSKLNMRALAEQLNVTAMSIYRYIPNKDALLSRMVDAVIANLPLPPPSPATWASAFREHAWLAWQEFSRYPGLVGSFYGGPSQPVIDHMGYELSILLASGVEAKSAALAVTTYHTFMLGLYRTHAYLDFLMRHDVRHTGVSTEAIRRHGQRMKLDELFHFAIDAVTHEVERRTQLAAGNGSPPRRPRPPR